MTTRTVPLLAAVAVLAGAVPTALAATPPPGNKTVKCGNANTANGGKARYIRANKVACTKAKAIARRANGKAYKTSGFSCITSSGIYLCTKSGSKQTVAFQYKKPS
jgi:hypothetical protein